MSNEVNLEKAVGFELPSKDVSQFHTLALPVETERTRSCFVWLCLCRWVGILEIYFCMPSE